MSTSLYDQHLVLGVFLHANNAVEDFLGSTSKLLVFATNFLILSFELLLHAQRETSIFVHGVFGGIAASRRFSMGSGTRLIAPVGTGI
jgi:hypothetical protein